MLHWFILNNCEKLVQNEGTESNRRKSMKKNLFERPMSGNIASSLLERNRTTPPASLNKLTLTENSLNSLRKLSIMDISKKRSQRRRKSFSTDSILSESDDGSESINKKLPESPTKNLTILVDDLSSTVSNLYKNSPGKLQPIQSLSLSISAEVQLQQTQYIEYRKNYFIVLSHIFKYFPNTLNERDAKGQNYFAYVLQTNSIDLLQVILLWDPDIIYKRDGLGKSCLHYVVRYCNSVHMFNYLINSFPSSKELYSLTFDYQNNTPLHDASKYCYNIDIMKELIFLYSSACKYCNKLGLYPIHLAMQNNNLNIIRFIHVASPSMISQTDRLYKWFPLHHGK